MLALSIYYCGQSLLVPLEPLLSAVPPAHALQSVSLLASAAPMAPIWSSTAPTWSSTTPGPSLLTATTASDSTLLSVRSRPGLALSPATQPFPQRIVDRALAGDFIEMRELLSDNITLLSQLESIQAYPILPAMPGQLRPRLRDITSLPTWIYCFLAYMAICTTDLQTRDQLAYARLLVRESLIHPGRGWLEYDRVFRQQRALDCSIPWNTLHPGIQAATIIGHSPGPASFCSLCREPDHTAQQCALAYTQSPPPRSSLPPGRSSYYPPEHPVCRSWNRGRCSFPGSCSYRHVCAICLAHHMAKDCTKTPRSGEGGR